MGSNHRYSVRCLVVLVWLCLVPAVSWALPAGVYGTWNGSWYVDTMYYNDGETTTEFTWSEADGWAPYALWGEATPSPTSPHAFSLVLHDFDGEDYGELYTAGEEIFDGQVGSIDCEDGVLTIGIFYAAQGYGGTITVGWNDTVGATLMGDFDEDSTPPAGYVSWLGEVAMTNTAPAPVPEPATLLLLGSGVLALAGFRRKR